MIGRMSVDLSDLKRFDKKIRTFSVDLEKSPVGLNKLTMRLVKLMRLNAPSVSGELADSIKWKKVGIRNYKIFLSGPGASYAGFQEKGFTPHWIPINWIRLHAHEPGRRGEWIPRGDIPYFVKVSKYTPFIKPSIDSMRTDLGPTVMHEILNLWKRSK